jgi:hypothetical protein
MSIQATGRLRLGAARRCCAAAGAGPGAARARGGEQRHDGDAAHDPAPSPAVAGRLRLKVHAVATPCAAGPRAFVGNETSLPAILAGAKNRVSGLPKVNLHDVRHSYATAGRDVKIDWESSQRADRSFGRGLHDEAVRADRSGSAAPGRNHPRRADHSRVVSATLVAEAGDSVHKSVHTRHEGSPGASAPRP